MAHSGTEIDSEMYSWSVMVAVDFEQGISNALNNALSIVFQCNEL